jgi:hypothetical protein
MRIVAAQQHRRHRNRSNTGEVRIQASDVATDANRRLDVVELALGQGALVVVQREGRRRVIARRPDLKVAIDGNVRELVRALRVHDQRLANLLARLETDRRNEDINCGTLRRNARATLAEPAIGVVVGAARKLKAP